MQELFALFPLLLLLPIALMNMRRSIIVIWTISVLILKALPLIFVAPPLVIVLRSLSVWLPLASDVSACIMVLFMLIWTLLKHRAFGSVSGGYCQKGESPLFMTVPPSDTINLLNVSNFEKL